MADPAAARPDTPDHEQALRFYQRGQELLERGDVDAARRFFERAADMGLPQGAMALATTYDPNELAKLKVVGLKGNIAAARKWYDRAAELGATEASERLRRLNAR
jgi:TPR repeat protein